MTSQRQATANLVHNGEYSDLRFVNMMSAHHAMAVSMAEVAVEKGEHSELVQFAKTMIEDQKKGKRRPCPIDFHGSVTLMERRVSL